MISHLQHVNPDSNVLLVGILPCAAESAPGPDGTFPWPNSLSTGIAHVNKALEEFASQHNLVHYIDCADDMLVGDQVRAGVCMRHGSDAHIAVLMILETAFDSACWCLVNCKSLNSVKQDIHLPLRAVPHGLSSSPDTAAEHALIDAVSSMCLCKLTAYLLVV